MKGRNAQVLRIYRVLSILEAAPLGVTVSDLTGRLAERGFEVGKRTVYRDLEALQAAGFPLEERSQPGDGGARWMLDRSAKSSHHLTFSPSELLALYLARSTLQSFKDTPFSQNLSAIFEKIGAKIGSKASSFIEDLSREIHFDMNPTKALGINQDILDTVRAAVTEHQNLKITYTSVNAGTTSVRTVGPHYLYFAKASLYVVAEDLEEGTVKIFSLARILDAAMLDEPYTGTVTDPAVYFANSFGIFQGTAAEQVRVAFGPKVSAFIKERQWHPTQKIAQAANGWIEVQLEVAQTPELLQWILSFGSQAKVLSPQTLAQKLSAEAKLISAVYQDQNVG